MKQEIEVKNNLSDVYIVIRKNLYKCKTKDVIIDNIKYHHNTSYSSCKFLIKNGILSIEEVKKLNGEKLTEKEQSIYNDDYHVNGISSISIANMNIDFTNITKDELIYDPFLPNSVDILISNNIKAARNSMNYVNEYLVDKKISSRKIKSIDIRLLKLLLDEKILKYDSETERITKAIKYYNSLRHIAKQLKESNLNIPIREASEDVITLDINKVLDMPKLLLRK